MVVLRPVVPGDVVHAPALLREEPVLQCALHVVARGPTITIITIICTTTITTVTSITVIINSIIITITITTITIIITTLSS